MVLVNKFFIFNMLAIVFVTGLIPIIQNVKIKYFLLPNRLQVNNFLCLKIAF